MNDEPDKYEGKSPEQDSRKDPRQDPRQGPRQDRLKKALRENLRRRKSQAKERGGVTAAPSEDDDLSPHDPGRKAE
jgi:hypothetical protein